MIKIDIYDLLELFEKDPEIFGEEKTGIYKYKKLNKYGFTFELNFSLLDQTCRIILFHEDLREPLFDLNFENIETINCREDKLIIKQKENLKNIVIYFKPNYHLNFEDEIN